MKGLRIEHTYKYSDVMCPRTSKGSLGIPILLSTIIGGTVIHTLIREGYYMKDTRCRLCSGRGGVHIPGVLKAFTWVACDWIACDRCKGTGRKINTSEESYDARGDEEVTTRDTGGVIQEHR